MKVLHLPIKEKWFDMILSGEKKEEYREIKEYWGKRLLCGIGLSPQFFGHGFSRIDRIQSIPQAYYKKFEIIRFKNGYSKNAPSFEIECKGIDIGHGLIAWGAEPNKEYFVIKLGNIIK